jgi:hypothetical protein
VQTKEMLKAMLDNVKSQKAASQMRGSVQSIGTIPNRSNAASPGRSRKGSPENKSKNGSPNRSGAQSKQS